MPASQAVKDICNVHLPPWESIQLTSHKFCAKAKEPQCISIMHLHSVELGHNALLKSPVNHHSLRYPSQLAYNSTCSADLSCSCQQNPAFHAAVQDVILQILLSSKADAQAVQLLPIHMTSILLSMLWAVFKHMPVCMHTSCAEHSPFAVCICLFFESLEQIGALECILCIL